MSSRAPVSSGRDDIDRATGLSESPSNSAAGTKPPWWFIHRLAFLPATFALTLYLLGTSRWGSYVGVPGSPIYIGDLLFALGAVQVAVVGRASLRALDRAPIVLPLCLALVSYAIIRLLAGGDLSLVALRDFAPYGYGAVALLAFLLPADRVPHGGRAIYGVLALHLIWLGLLPRIPGFAWSLPMLGNDVPLLGARPDFDAAVAGIAAALALFDLLRPTGHHSRHRQVLLAVFLCLNLFVLTTLSTRAGLLSAVAVLSATFFVSFGGRRRPEDNVERRRRGLAIRVLTAAIVVIGLSAALAVTPTGKRLIEGFNSGSSQAAGTVAVRSDVWNLVASYTLRDAERTAIGIGFGRNFIQESGARPQLEGQTYSNVRSPHNYVVGTMARLGVAGALLVILIMVLATSLAWSALRSTTQPSTVLAALIALSIPVVAMFGVVLEAPFGALPYFWAVGELARYSLSATSSRQGRAADGV